MKAPRSLNWALASTDRPRCAPSSRQLPVASRVAASLAMRSLSRRHDLPRSRLVPRSEEHTSELQSLMRISYAVFCLKKKNNLQTTVYHLNTRTIKTHEKLITHKLRSRKMNTQ